MLAESDDARFSDNSVLRDPNEIGVAEVSSSLYENVTRYHAQVGKAGGTTIFLAHVQPTPDICTLAQIGQNVNRDELQQLEWNLLGEAKMLFHQRKFEEALNTFTHCLAVTEKTRSAKDHAVRGAVIHNIASCLHNLGEMEAAQVKKTRRDSSSPACFACAFVSHRGGSASSFALLSAHLSTSEEPPPGCSRVAGLL